MKSIATSAIGLLFCGSAFAETHVVGAYSMTFVPAEVTVVPGDIIRWEYVTGYPHDVTSGTKCMDDGYLFLDIPDFPGGYVEWTVPEDAPSEIPYFCQLHCGSGMTGMINVEGDEVGGHMYVGIVDITNCEFLYAEGEETATLTLFSNPGGASSFAWGVEIEDADVDVDVIANATAYAVLYLHDPSVGTSSPLTSGTYTLSAGQRYMFHGSNSSANPDPIGFEFSLSWPEDGDEEGFALGLSGSGNCSVTSATSEGDHVALRAAEGGNIFVTLTTATEIEVPMSIIANVTSTTLTLPASGEEANVVVPIGTHTINIGFINTNPPGMGMLIMQMGDGDGGGDSLPEDVNGDGVVDVSDLLAIISVWGATSP